MSMQKFGDYSIQTIQSVNLWAKQSFMCWVYVRRDWHDEAIAGPESFCDEAHAYSWAHGKIKAHKEQVERLKELTK